MMSDEYRQKFNIDETVQWVINCYRQVLKRDPDEEGLRVYVDHIVKGRIKKEDLPRILMESDEYRSRFCR
jgi:20S proteasome alpha/beta subunit